MAVFIYFFTQNLQGLLQVPTISQKKKKNKKKSGSTLLKAGVVLNSCAKVRVTAGKKGFVVICKN